MGRTIISLTFVLSTFFCCSQKIKDKDVHYVKGEITKSFLLSLDHAMNTDKIIDQLPDSLSFGRIIEIHVESFSLDSIPVYTYYSEINLNFEQLTPIIYRSKLLKKERLDQITFIIDSPSGKDFRVECSLTADPINSNRIMRSMNIIEVH